MEQFTGKFCKLCRNIISSGDFEAIEDTTTEVLDTLLKLSAEEKNILVRCNACCTKLFAAFNFKRLCMDTEDCIFPYVNSDNGASVDLREVYLKQRGEEHLKGTLEDKRICRLCMQVVNCEFTAVEDVDIDMLHRYIPTVNFNSIKEPVICKLCLDALNVHTNFLKNFLNMKEEINDTCDTDTEESLISIKCEDIEIKSEENYSDTSFCNLEDQPSNYTDVCKSEYGEITNNSMLKDTKNGHEPKYQLKYKDSSENQIYNCDLCVFKTVYKCSLSRHRQSHKNIPENQMYKCDLCDYKSIFKSNINQHQVKHKKHRYKCDSCDFETVYKYNFRQHQQTHKDMSEKQVYKCDYCDFKSVYKSSLLHHQLKHKKLRYKCDSCDFETAHENVFTRHQQRHKDIPEDKMYKCDICDYKSIFKNSLGRHHLKHKKRKYKCDLCDFETIYKHNLAQHQQRHKDVPEELMHKCDFCDYKSHFKNNLDQHQFKHKKHRYKCDLCDFETIYKHNFKQHQQTHKDISEKQVYKCDLCDCKFVYKRNLVQHLLRHERA